VQRGPMGAVRYP